METSAKVWMGVAILLFFVILGMVWVLLTVPAVTATPVVSTSTPQKPAEAPSTQKPDENAPLSHRVQITAPQPNTTVGQRFEVKGEAPGNWFFEASFPIQIRDKDGNVIARTHASAQGEWMTTEQVKFTSTINIETAYKGPATLILMRDNPSGLPENDDSTEIPIIIN